MFITPDTIVPRPYDPQSLNRYAYCRNNPLIYVDPSGHDLIGMDDWDMSEHIFYPRLDFDFIIPGYLDVPFIDTDFQIDSFVNPESSWNMGLYFDSGVGSDINWSSIDYSYPDYNASLYSSRIPMVYQYFRKADIPLNENIGLPHTWLKTDIKEAGLGPDAGHIPGVGTQKDSPYITGTMIVDHLGQSERPESWYVSLPDVSADYVNKALIINKPMGKWTGINQCWNFVEQIKIDGRYRCLK